MKYFALVILTLCITPLSAHAETDIQTVRINDNLHMLVSPQGGNVVASTGADGVFIIDDQLTGRSEILDTAIKAIKDQEVKFILNTHFHFDHTGGNEHFGEDGAIIVAHDNVRKRLSTDQFITFFKKEMKASTKSALPVVTFAKNMTLHYNGDDIKLVHLPAAHTDGDVAAYFVAQNVIVAGDAIFNGMYPFIDVEHGGSIDGILKAHEVFLALADDETVIVPGHGDLLNKVTLQTYTNALSTIADTVKTSVANGKTLEQIIASKPTAEFDDTLGGGFITPDVFTTVLYDDLSR